MQPYFFPYGGYYRLLAEAHTFVLFDCVQFARRGRVHRCQVADRRDRTEWLTLPLAHQPRSILIRDLEFANDARRKWNERLDCCKWLKSAQGPLAPAVLDYLYSPLDRVVCFLERGLRLVADALGLRVRIVRSSSLDIDPSLRRQERIIAITHACGGREYLNSPGGRQLYSAETFQEAGLKLRFLPPYSGTAFHMLHALVHLDIQELRDQIR
jgi:hypothetical protein